MTGNQRLEERKKCLRLSTGSSAFDAMLGGFDYKITPVRPGTY